MQPQSFLRSLRWPKKREMPSLFQSRNRGSFLFKAVTTSISRLQTGFNLVIEVLFFSRRRNPIRWLLLMKGFNLVIEVLFFSRGFAGSGYVFPMGGFNLVIEVLFFSSGLKPRGYALRVSCFNLVIEVLFFSSAWGRRLCVMRHGRKFQSRNRGSFLFKSHGRRSYRFSEPVSIS